MKNGTTYTPRAGSLPAEVIYFFTNNPEEELTLDDITDKFDCTRGNVHTNLGLAVDARVLVRDRNVDGDYIYKAGPMIPAKAAAPAQVLAQREPYAKVKKPRVSKEELPAIDAIAIEDDVPVPSTRGPRIDWKPLLAKLKKGQSFKVPLQARHTLSNDMTELRKANQGTFTLRAFKDANEVRVWRTA